MQELLGLHPQIHFIGFEPFDSYRFSYANRPDDRNELPLSLLTDWLEGRLDKLSQTYARLANRPVHFDRRKIQGCKFRLHNWTSAEHRCQLPCDRKSICPCISDQHFAPFMELFEKNDVHLFFVRRNCLLLQAFSGLKGHLQFNLKRGDLDLEKARTPIDFDIADLKQRLTKLQRYTVRQNRMYQARQNQNPQRCSWLTYEEFLYRKRSFLRNALASLGCNRDDDILDAMLAATPSLKKVHPDRLEDIAANHAEIAKEFPQWFGQYKALSDKYLPE